jgi:hypothetical protein
MTPADLIRADQADRATVLMLRLELEDAHARTEQEWLIKKRHVIRAALTRLRLGDDVDSVKFDLGKGGVVLP